MFGTRLRSFDGLHAGTLVAERHHGGNNGERYFRPHDVCTIWGPSLRDYAVDGIAVAVSRTESVVGWWETNLHSNDFSALVIDRAGHRRRRIRHPVPRQREPDESIAIDDDGTVFFTDGRERGESVRTEVHVHGVAGHLTVRCGGRRRRRMPSGSCIHAAIVGTFLAR